MKHPINWFEIPVTDLDRAARFYETVFGLSLQRQSAGGVQMAIFPYEAPATGGALCQCAMLQPSTSGPALYLDGGEDLALPLGRVEAAGGKVHLAKTFISPEVGHMAFFDDTEGNRIGLHSRH